MDSSKVRSFRTLAGGSSCALLARLLAVGVVADETQRDVLLELREGDGCLPRLLERPCGVLLVLGVALEAVLVRPLATTNTLVSVLAAQVEHELAEDLDLDLTNSPVGHGERIRQDTQRRILCCYTGYCSQPPEKGKRPLLKKEDDALSFILSVHVNPVGEKV